MPAIQHLQANGLRFAYLEEGRGPLVLLIHGFPDTAYTWDAVRPALAARGYRAVSPFTRGYFPTEVPADGRYDAESMGRDVLAWITALGEQQAIVVGHDWGANAAYMAASLAPERVRFLATIGVPHPAGILPSPRLMWRMRHFIALRRRNAEATVRAHDFAYVDELVKRWSPAWRVPVDETRAVKDVFSRVDSLTAAVSYYRAFTPQLPAALRKLISVPSVVFAGREDGVLSVSDYTRAKRHYAAPHQVIPLPGGHFLHREHPEAFIAALLAALPAP